jgi:glycosyltransferase involved in cell wall biosynthesis
MNSKKFLISVITPYYRGAKYMSNLKKMIEANAISLGEGDKAEWIIVNDSPEETVPILASNIINIQIFVNEKNSGIHFSRRQGISKSKGKYLLMLDQDDNISNDFFEKTMNVFKQNKVDVVVGNAWIEDNDPHKRSKRYGRKSEIKDVTDLDVYLMVTNPIVSPGQCLIKRSALPEVYEGSNFKNNGSDDLFLWIVMLKQGKRFFVIEDCLYTHRFTGENVSGDALVIAKSSQSVADRLKELNILNNKEYDKLCRSIQWQLKDRKSKIKSLVLDYDIIIKRLSMKIARMLSRKIV